MLVNCSPSLSYTYAVEISPNYFRVCKLLSFLSRRFRMLAWSEQENAYILHLHPLNIVEGIIL